MNEDWALRYLPLKIEIDKCGPLRERCSKAVDRQLGNGLFIIQHVDIAIFVWESPPNGFDGNLTYVSGLVFLLTRSVAIDLLPGDCICPSC